MPWQSTPFLLRNAAMRLAVVVHDAAMSLAVVLRDTQVLREVCLRVAVMFLSDVAFIRNPYTTLQRVWQTRLS